MLPKKMFWIESLFSRFPINKKATWQQMIIRVAVLFGIWISGLLIHALDGLTANYIQRLSFHLPYFCTFFLILLGSYFVQTKLSQIIQDFRPMLKLDEKEFQKFSEGLKRAIYSFFPCLVIAVVLAVVAGLPSQFQHAFAEGLSLHIIWNFLFNAFAMLLTATAVWMFASIWLAIFVISRQPLDLKLSSETLAGFRELSLLALWFSLFYFIGVSIGNISYFVDVQSFSVSEMFLSPYLFFIVLGVVGILLPFYNIHTILFRLKQQELARIFEESETLVKQLDEALKNQKESQQVDRRIEILHYRLFTLQVKEKHAKAAKEWPIDVSFVSKLLVLVLIPIISRILAMLIIS
jgi:sensor histidine kinase YesM